MSARDASGVPAPLRELLGLLSKLTEVPLPASDDDWNQYQLITGKRRAALEVRLNSLADTLEVNDGYPEIAADALEQHCERAIEKCRERLAEPLGYEPQAAEDAMLAEAPAAECLSAFGLPHGGIVQCTERPGHKGDRVAGGTDVTWPKDGAK